MKKAKRYRKHYHQVKGLVDKDGHIYRTIIDGATMPNAVKIWYHFCYR